MMQSGMRRVASVFVAMAAVAVGLSAPADAAGSSGVSMTAAKAWDGSPLHVGAIALSPGRITWSDNSIKGGMVWTRVLTKTSTGFTAGPAHKLGVGMPGRISASGLRTAWLSGQRVVVRSGYATTTLSGSFYSVKLSGLRLLASNATQIVLFDLRTGGRTDLVSAYGADPTGYYGYQAADLSGDTLVYSKSDGTVWSRNIVSGLTVKLRNPTAPASSISVAGTEVYAGGNSVGWAHFDSDLCTKTESAIFGVTAGPSKAHWLADDCGHPVAEYGRLAGLSVDGWIDRSDLSDPSPGDLWFGTSYLTLWDLTRPITVPGISVDGPYNAYIYAYNTVVNDTESPMAYEPRVALLPRAVAVRPQSLGNVAAPASATRGGSWQVIDVASAVVHTCRVDIRNSKGVVVRSLGCQAAWQQGEIRAVWDGKAASGAYVPSGTYTWTIVAGNSTGSLLNSDGSTAPLTGTVTIS